MRINKLFIATIFACASAIASGENLQSGMKVSDKLKAAWDSPEIKGRIERGIEQNRKGDFKITFDKPVENLKVSLLRHEFVFGAPTMAIAATQDENGNIDMQRVKNMKKLVWEELFNGATLSVLWKYYEPQPGVYRFEKNAPYMRFRPSPAFVLDEFKDLDLTYRAHCLTWFNKQWFFSDWVERTAEDSAAASDIYIKKVCERFGTEIPYWNIANEFCTFYDSDVRKFMHKDAVYKAFIEARKHLPESAVFTYNELTDAWDDAYRNREYCPLYLLVQNLLLRGCKVDEIGLQLHVFSEKLWSDILNGKAFRPEFMLNVLDLYAELGLPLQITEITIPGLPEGPVGEENQAYIAEKFYRLWFSHPAVNSITWWHTVDGTSKAEGKWKSGILNFDFTKKKSYDVLKRLIKDEWTTNAGSETPVKALDFRGFYGKYKVSYTVDGKNYETVIPFHKNGAKTRFIKAIPQKNVGVGNTD